MTFFVVPIEAFRTGRRMNVTVVCMVAALFLWERYLLWRRPTIAAQSGKVGLAESGPEGEYVPRPTASN